MLGADYKNFYTNYAYDYHIYKVATLKSILNNSTGFNEQFLAGKLVGLEDSDYIRFLKSEIRMTCFHAIETLFELIFALEPMDGECKDYTIMQTISTANFTKNYNRISGIATDDSKLDFLDLLVPEFEKDPLWMHIFFLHPPVDEPGMAVVLEDSKEAIRKFLKEIAKTFSARDEYNAYKHGFRAVNTFTEFGISDTDGANPASVDLSDSMSYITVEKDQGKVKALILNVKVFNTNKDIKMIELCSMLISNIILRRKYILVPEQRKGPLHSTSFPTGAVNDMINTYSPFNGSPNTLRRFSMDTMSIRTEI